MLDFSFCLPTRVLFGKGAQKLIPEQIKKAVLPKCCSILIIKRMWRRFPFIRK